MDRTADYPIWTSGRILCVAAILAVVAVSPVQAQPPSRPTDPPNATVFRDIAYVTRDDPPFLIVHGDKDPLVPHNQSEMLSEALQKAGVDTTFYTVQGVGHGGFRDPQVDVLVTEFFNKHLCSIGSL